MRCKILAKAGKSVDWVALSLLDYGYCGYLLCVAVRHSPPGVKYDGVVVVARFCAWGEDGGWLGVAGWGGKYYELLIRIPARGEIE